MARVPQQPAQGFALITVLAVVLLVSAVALTLASTLRVEARQVLSERIALELDERVAAGQEMALFLASRRLGTPAENLEGLPVTIVQSGFHYRLQLPGGAVELYLEAEDGKLNLSTAPEALLESFFSLWAGDAARGAQLSTAVKDWRDLDEDGSAEAPFYAAAGYAPRNRKLGIADATLLPGIVPESFRDRLALDGVQPVRLPGLAGLLTDAPVGSTVNPNFAPELVLGAIPGLSADHVRQIQMSRIQALFQNAADFGARIRLAEGSAALMFLHFEKRAPAVLTVARSEDGRVVRSQRRVNQPLSVLNPATGGMDTIAVVGRVDRNVLPDWLGPVQPSGTVPK
jgi:type II secretory pathway component PulK